MARPVATQPTEVELQILGILWERGPSTVRQVHEGLVELKQSQYPTTVKMLLVMLDKGLVKRDDLARPIVYRAGISREKTQKRMLAELLKRVYEGSAKTLMMHAMTAKKATPEEVAEIRRFLADLENPS